jgi:type III pantothenate kinase
MMLMIDMGNSSIKWAILEQDRLSPLQRFAYDNLENQLTLAWLRLDKPLGIWVSNVAGPKKADILSQWVKSHWGLIPTFVKTSRHQCGVTNGYEHAEQLGVDRWLALIGAYQLYSAPTPIGRLKSFLNENIEKSRLCVVDCGTAVTLDVLSADGQHQGGLIMPGVTTMCQSLKTDTYALEPLNTLSFDEKNFDKVPEKTNHQVNSPNRVSVLNKQFSKNFQSGSTELMKGFSDKLLAHDTQAGITLGTLYAVIGLLEYVINRLEKPGNQIKLILTGGSAPVLEFFFKTRTYQLIPELVLLGLVAVANQSL